MPPYREEPQFQDAEVRGESAGVLHFCLLTAACVSASTARVLPRCVPPGCWPPASWTRREL